MIGVYKIVCDISNRYYIGSSKNIKKRYNRHLKDLRNNNYINIHLQRAFNKYGENNFHIEIIQICNEEDLLNIEQELITDNYEYTFNIGKNAAGGDNLSGNPRRDEIIKKISESKMSESERMEKWSKPGEKNPNFGNTWTDEMRKKASEREKNNLNNPLRKRKGKTNKDLYGEEKANEISKKLSEHASKRTGDKNSFYNRKHTEEAKNKIRDAKLGTKPPNRIKLSIDDKIYESYREASDALKIPITTIRWRCLSDNIKFKDYKLI